MPRKPLFFPADAHEGPVWVAEQHRLYYATKTHLSGRRRVDIEYLDFGAVPRSGFASSGSLPVSVAGAAAGAGVGLWEQWSSSPAISLSPQTFIHDANMANGMRLEADGRSLLIAEQGYEDRPAVVSRISLYDRRREVLVADFRGQPFNSINKAIRSATGHLIFSDPDYGFRQGFKPPPELEPNVYVKIAGGELYCFRCGLEMPHGLALSPDERSLFISDTSNEGAHGEGITLGRRKSVWRYNFDPASGTLSGPGTCCFQVAAGVPDGMLCTQGCLLVGGGDGIYVADTTGALRGKIPTSYSAVNLTLAGDDDQHLFVTADEGVLLFPDWRAFVEEA